MTRAVILRELRNTRKSQGLCPHCGVSVAGTGLIYCQKFRTGLSDRRFRRGYKSKYKPVQATIRYQRRKQRLEKAGLCVRCGLVKVQRMKHCLGCRTLKRCGVSRKQKSPDHSGLLS